MKEDKIDSNELKYLISGEGIVSKQISNPAPDWVNGRTWNEILCIQVCQILDV